MTIWTPQEIWKLPNVVEHVNQIERSITFGHAVVERVKEQCFGKVGSPIEAIFALWWEAHLFAYRSFHATHFDLRLVPQHVVAADGMNYRIDFMVSAHYPAHLETVAARLDVPLFPLLGVELDGHDFHEKTKEQVTYRNKRDRALQRLGWEIHHVSGSELHSNPAATVHEFLHECINKNGDFYRQLGARLLETVHAKGAAR